MDKLTLQIKAVCLISILTGVMGCIIPSCRLKKAFNSFCAVVIVFAIMMPLSSLGKNTAELVLSGFDASEEDTSAEYETAEEMIYKRVVEKAVTESFSESGINVTVTVECERVEAGYEIISFSVYGFNAEEKEIITDYFNRGFNGIPVYFKEE